MTSKKLAIKVFKFGGASIKDADSILEHILVENPDFRDLDRLTKQIERETMKFIKDVESFLSKH